MLVIAFLARAFWARGAVAKSLCGAKHRRSKNMRRLETTCGFLGTAGRLNAVAYCPGHHLHAPILRSTKGST